MYNLTAQIRQILEDELKHLKIYNVAHLGYRYFLPDGRSFGCPTTTEWYTKPRDPQFYDSMKNYLCEELVRLHKTKASYVTRSGDHQEDVYLSWLKQFNMNNSIGIYKFHPGRIDSVFFIYKSNIGETRDLLINKINILERHVNTITKKIDAIFDIISRSRDVELHLDMSQYHQLFGAAKRGLVLNQKHLTVLINGKSIDLNDQEINVLKILSVGTSNKCIASELDLSEKTIEKYIGKLKNKFNVPSKNNLITLAHTSQLQVALN